MDFFGFGGYQREPEGWGSWQQLLLVTSFVVAMVFFAVFFGVRYRHEEEAKKLFVLKVTAIVLDTIELTRIVILSFRSGNPMQFMYHLPLFLCSFQFITVPIAAFGKGRIREAAADFVFLFGILGSIAGTYGAGQNYSAYPVWSFDNVFSTITHTMSGFAGLFVVISGLLTFKAKNIKWVVITLFAFAVVAYIVNISIDYNYMFLMRGDGTPYDIFYNLVNGNRILYPLTVMFLFFLYMGAVYGVAYAIPSFRSHAFAKEVVVEAN